MSLEAIAKLCDTDHHLIGKIVRKRGLAIRPRESYCSYSVNHSAFDLITEESAYWVGFLMADGCITEAAGGHRPQVRLQLQWSDQQHVQLFKEFIQSTSPIKKYQRKLHRTGRTFAYCSFSFTSQRIAERLAQFGVVPRKTKTAKAIILEGNQHFWRGVIDGDGCLTWSAGKPVISLAGSQSLVIQFAEFIRASHGFKLTPKNYRSHGQGWAIEATCQKACVIVRHLYESCHIALNRKLERASLIIEAR